MQHLQPIKAGREEWAFVYEDSLYEGANEVIQNIMDAQKSLGVSFDKEPLYIEVPNARTLEKDGVNRNELRDGGHYVYCIKNDLKQNSKIKIAFVLIKNERDHPRIKKALDQLGIASQFLTTKKVTRIKKNAMGIFSNILK